MAKGLGRIRVSTLRNRPDPYWCKGLEGFDQNAPKIETPVP